MNCFFFFFELCFYIFYFLFQIFVFVCGVFCLSNCFVFVVIRSTQLTFQPFVFSFKFCDSLILRINMLMLVLKDISIVFGAMWVLMNHHYKSFTRDINWTLDDKIQRSRFLILWLTEQSSLEKRKKQSAGEIIDSINFITRSFFKQNI